MLVHVRELHLTIRQLLWVDDHALLFHGVKSRLELHVRLHLDVGGLFDFGQADGHRAFVVVGRAAHLSAKILTQIQVVIFWK